MTDNKPTEGTGNGTIVEEMRLAEQESEQEALSKQIEDEEKCLASHKIIIHRLQQQREDLAKEIETQRIAKRKQMWKQATVAEPPNKKAKILGPYVPKPTKSILTKITKQVVINLGQMLIKEGKWSCHIDDDTHDSTCEKYWDGEDNEDRELDPKEIVIRFPTINMTFYYPLLKEIDFMLTANSANGFTRKEISKKIMKVYKRMYREEKAVVGDVLGGSEKGPYGIQHHKIEDLVLTGITYFPETQQYYIDVESSGDMYRYPDCGHPFPSSVHTSKHHKCNSCHKD